MYTTHLRKVGGSVMLAIPPAFLDQLHLQAGAAVGVALSDGCLVIDPKSRPHYTLADSQPPSAQEREWIDAPARGGELI
jgi:antitoxin ChpS